MALHLPLFVLVLIPLLSTALATHNQISPATTTASRRHHHRSRTNTATAHFHTVPSATSSMHQNYLETEESKSLLAVDSFTAEAQASSGAEAMAAAATGDDRPGLLVPPQASPPPPTLVAAPDLISRAQPQPQEESETNAASTTTTLLPLPNQQTSVATESPPPPLQAGVAAELSRVLTSLGYNEMASVTPLLANSPPLARWPGAITVFAAPDVFLQASCPTCSRRHLLLQHIAMGYYPYSELAASPSTKIPSASAGLCVEIIYQSGPFGIHYARIYADGVKLTRPDQYMDNKYVVHGLQGLLRPRKCVESSLKQHYLARITMKIGTSRHADGRRAKPRSAGLGVASGIALAAAATATFVCLSKKFVKQENLRRKVKSFSRYGRSVGDFDISNPAVCQSCLCDATAWRTTCCGGHCCCSCLVQEYMRTHARQYFRSTSRNDRLCSSEGVILSEGGDVHPLNQQYAFQKIVELEGTVERTFIYLPDLMEKKAPRRLIDKDGSIEYVPPEPMSLPTD